MSKRVSRKTEGFGFDQAQSPHHFAVKREGTGAVILTEHLVVADEAGEEDQASSILKAVLDGYRWERIATVAEEVFNHRLRQAELKPATWTRMTRLAPHFGKELVLLAWAVEDADPTVIPAMLANWAGLAPEERWWLYTTINATSNHRLGKERGWRKAIKIAFAENPVSDVAPSTLLGAPLTEPRQRGGRLNRRPSSALPEPVPEQGRLPMAGPVGR